MYFSCYNAAPGSVAVVHAIHGYVDSFFTCSYCKEHFLSMAEQMKLLSIKEDQTAVLAFWEAHNQVNHRLSTEIHDPYFPKIQYPPRSLCAKCSDNAGQFDSDQVFGFLMRHYRRVRTPFGRMRLVEGNQTVDNVDVNPVKYRTRHSSVVVNKAEISEARGFSTFAVFVFAIVGLLCLFVLLKRKLRIFNCRRLPYVGV